MQIHSNDHLYAERDTRLFGFHQDSHLLAEKQTEVAHQINGFLILGCPDRREPMPVFISETRGQDAWGWLRRCYTLLLSQGAKLHLKLNANMWHR